MKRLLMVTTVIEVGAGVALMCCPSATVALLLASGLDTSAAVTVGRVAGAALFALGVACWLAQYDAQSSAARGLVSAMLLYNLGAVVILRAAGIRSRPVGVALCPAVCSSRSHDRLVCHVSSEKAGANRRESEMNLEWTER